MNQRDIDSNEFARQLVRFVDGSLQGSEAGVSGWKIFRRILLTCGAPTLDEVNDLADLEGVMQAQVSGASCLVDLDMDRVFNA